MVKRNSILLALVLTTLVSCKKEAFYDSYQSVNGAWSKSDVKSFTVAQEDILSGYNLFLNVRNNKEYAFSNLFVIVSVEQPNQTIWVDTLEYQMAKPDGTLLGTGFSDIKENKLWVKENYVFPTKGEYTFKVEQVVREIGDVEGVESLKGISEIGIQIEKTK